MVRRDGDRSMEDALGKGGKAPVRRRQVDLERAESFIAGGGRPPIAETPIEGLNPDATPRIRFNIVFNDFEMAALRRRSERTGMSMQRILRSLIVPVLREGEESHG